MESNDLSKLGTCKALERRKEEWGCREGGRAGGSDREALTIAEAELLVARVGNRLREGRKIGSHMMTRAGVGKLGGSGGSESGMEIISDWRVGSLKEG